MTSSSFYVYYYNHHSYRRSLALLWLGSCLIFLGWIPTICHGLSTSSRHTNAKSNLQNKHKNKNNNGSFSTLQIRNLPHVGYTKVSKKSTKNAAEFFVIGTSHFQCQSAQEVTSLIETVQPDGIVIELDPERTIRLTKQDSMGNNNNVNNNINGNINGNDKIEKERILYGADFLAAINTAQRMDIPIFLGDEPTQQTQQRFINKLLLPTSYSPIPLLESLLLPWNGNNKSNNNNNNNKNIDNDIDNSNDLQQSKYINLISAFANDPQKLLPLVLTTLVPFLLLLGSLPKYEFGNDATNITTILSVIASFLAICKVFNSVIVDRDELLATRAHKAANIVSSLQQKKTVRIRWTFDADDNYQYPTTTTISTRMSSNESSPSLPSQGIPLFTLKTPLVTGGIRNLNLFEPRWLKMIDGLVASSSLSSSSSSAAADNDDSTIPPFGCVTCTNKFYSVIQTSNGTEGRYADVIFDRMGTLAYIANNDQIVEGNRPSGARKIGVQIQGGDNFYITNEQDTISVSKDGYLVASTQLLKKQNDNTSNDNKDNNNAITTNLATTTTATNEGISERPIKIVVVVGLLHANGIIRRLSGST